VNGGRTRAVGGVDVEVACGRDRDLRRDESGGVLIEKDEFLRVVGRVRTRSRVRGRLDRSDGGTGRRQGREEVVRVLLRGVDSKSRGSRSSGCWWILSFVAVHSMLLRLQKKERRKEVSSTFARRLTSHLSLPFFAALIPPLTEPEELSRPSSTTPLLPASEASSLSSLLHLSARSFTSSAHLRTLPLLASSFLACRARSSKS